MKYILTFALVVLAFSCLKAEKFVEQKKIVLLAGAKSHKPGDHEYLKTARLLKVLLDQAGISGLKTEVHCNGWPENEATLDDADLIFVTSDGQDGDKFSPVPFLTPERMELMQKQIDRGCGLFLLHFSVFTPDAYAPQILEWVGGYFDWQGDDGGRSWYSDIETLESRLDFPNKEHPVMNGLNPFVLHDEFYYRMRFKNYDPRLVPLLEVPELRGKGEKSAVVAWAVDRKDGGRGFATTTGHFYSNLKDENYRKFILNAILWSAGLEVPEDGVNSVFLNDSEVTNSLFNAKAKGLMLTGNNHPAHDWNKTTPVINQAIEKDGQIKMDVITDPEDFAEVDLKDYRFLVVNYCNWKDPSGLSEKSRKAFVNFLQDGGGLLLIHFANGAWHHSLPEAAASDWPEYRDICRRVWDHSSNSAHDKYGPFEVLVKNKKHSLTRRMKNFITTDIIIKRESSL